MKDYNKATVYDVILAIAVLLLAIFTFFGKYFI